MNFLQLTYRKIVEISRESAYGIKCGIGLFVLATCPFLAKAQMVAGDTTALEIVIPMEGETGVMSELEDAYEEDASLLGAPLQSYLNWKEKVKRETGFSYSLMGLWFYQHATKSLTENNDGLGQWYRVNANWTLIGRNTGHSGRIEARLEYRSNIGGLPSPTRLGSEIGIVAINPGFGYVDNFPLDLAVLNWTQMLLDNKLGFAIGRLSFDGYVDSSPFQSLTRGFTNRSLGLNPTLGITGIGSLGMVVKGDLPGGFWLGAHIYDANAVNGEFNQDVFRQNEWLTYFEAGWSPSDEQYSTDRIIFTYWHKDRREALGIRSGSGWVVSASHKVGEKFLPFVRFGHSNGGGGVVAESAFAAGCEWEVHSNQALSLGGGWARPVSQNEQENPGDEYVVESSYKIQLLQALQVLFDAQLIVNPAQYPMKTTVGVFGFRTILHI